MLPSWCMSKATKTSLTHGQPPSEKQLTSLPSGYNPRKMSESERRDLEDSIEEFGTVVPVILNIGTRNNILIGGHQRVSIYADLGIDEIDCMIEP